MKRLLEFHFEYIDKAKFQHLNLAFLVISSIFLLSIYAGDAHADSKIVKWKDANGVTHYGDKLPAQEAGRGNSVLSTQGTVIRQNESFNPNANNAEKERITADQSRKDAALLASYSSVEEINLALARNIKSDQVAVQTMRMRLSETQAKEKAMSKMYAGKKMPPDIIEQLRANHAQTLKLQSDIAATEYSISQTVQRFIGYKNRYLELRPRDETLTYIKANKKTLAELEAWKEDATNRLNALLTQSLAYKRTGDPVPIYISSKITQTNNEIARAEDEIAEAKDNIKKSQQTFSK